MALEAVSIPLVANSYYTIALAVGVFVPLLLVRLKVEEQEMIKKFGVQYEQYRHQVPVFFPSRWKGRKVPKEKSIVSTFPK